MVWGLLLSSVLVMLPFVLAVIRHLVLRTGRPARLRRALARRARPGQGVGVSVADELMAALNPNKRVEQEQRRTERIVKHDAEDGAPPRVGVDLASGKAVIRRKA
ncbi:DUF6191 domain-containing protein [Streptomyces sp. NBC_01304]|uniref:DUF6191 domain-containing protein n=1 Tax=Streptomyces sp. NBC_01304 TaxID=2903818 RepID=UPI002E142D60|nr:DUF6191 domain-containing protein [Streptomyces sp. NBC_01304]